jgi:hypothetical protein
MAVATAKRMRREHGARVRHRTPCHTVERESQKGGNGEHWRGGGEMGGRQTYDGQHKTKSHIISDGQNISCQILFMCSLHDVNN